MRNLLAGLIGLAVSLAAFESQEVCNRLADVPGFEAKGCDILAFPDPAGGEMQIVSRLYRNESGALNLSVVTGSRARGMIDALRRAKPRETESSSIRPLNFGEHAALLTYNKRLRSGTVTVDLGNGTVLVAAFDHLSPEAAIDLVKRQPLDRIQSALR